MDLYDLYRARKDMDLGSRLRVNHIRTLVGALNVMRRMSYHILGTFRLLSRQNFGKLFQFLIFQCSSNWKMGGMFVWSKIGPPQVTKLNDNTWHTYPITRDR